MKLDDFLLRVRTTPLGKLASHKWYQSPLPRLPDLHVIRLPKRLWLQTDVPGVNSSHLVTFVECEEDRIVIEQSMAIPLSVTAESTVDFDCTIGRVNTVPSAMADGESVIALYSPPKCAVGWPWFVVYAAPCNETGPGPVRGRYGSLGFETIEAARALMIKSGAARLNSGNTLTVM